LYAKNWLNKIPLCVSDKLLKEYFAVLNIPKLTTNPDIVLNEALFRKEIDRTA
jgi:predicted nucleic acid-binding protein